eukprot:10134105-Prorocentrum_lima.AAC.1
MAPLFVGTHMHGRAIRGKEETCCCSSRVVSSCTASLWQCGQSEKARRITKGTAEVGGSQPEEGGYWQAAWVVGRAEVFRQSAA